MLLCVLAATALTPLEVFVSPEGNDRWSGKIPAANRLKTDGPFRTLEAARDAVRAFPKDRTAKVWLRGGVYRRSSPLELDARDGGTVSAPRTWAAFRTEKPIVSGLQVLKVDRVEGPTWNMRVPEGVAFEQLWVNGVRQTRNRLGNQWMRVSDAVAPSDPAAGHDGFVAPKELDWATLMQDPTTQVLAVHTWTMSRNRIKSYDSATGVLRFRKATAVQDFLGAMPKGTRFLIETGAAPLAPGSWRLKPTERLAQYHSRSGESADKAIVEVPVADRLLVIAGTPESPVEHLTFEGIAWEGNQWLLGTDGRMFYQAEADLGGAVVLHHANDVKFAKCIIAKMGTYAVEIGTGCKRVDLVGCSLTDLGAGGIKIGTMSLDRDEPRITGYVSVQDCLIAGYGRLHPAAVGVWIGHSAYNQIVRNTIHDGYYTGVSVGWSWGYGESGAHHNRIEDNNISKIGQGLLSDMGGIYTLGVAPGTVLRGNRIHEVQAFGYGGWGIYPDEGSTGLLIENNCVFNTKAAGFHQHYGRDNLVRNNVFAFGQEAQVQRTRAEAHRSVTFEGNVVAMDGTPLLTGNWSGEGVSFDRNVYWSYGGKPFDFAGKTIDDWRAGGQDRGSLVADPRFFDRSRGDFRLKPGSPALAKGFVPFPALDPSRENRSVPKFLPAFPTQ